MESKPEPDKPENPNFRRETRQTRTRTLLKFENPIKPKPELCPKSEPEPEDFRARVSTNHDDAIEVNDLAGIASAEDQIDRRLYIATRVD